MNKSAINGRQNDMNSLISEKGASLVLEQAKVLLDSKVDKMDEELDYVRDRLEKITARLDEVRNDIIRTEPGVEKSANLMHKYKLEKEDLEDKCKDLGDIGEKIKVIAERKEDIEKSSRNVAGLHKKMNTLQQSNRDTAHTRGKKEEKLKTDTERHNSLSQNIRDLKEKILTYTARMSEYSTADELKNSKAEAKKDIRKFKTKISKNEEALNKMDRDLSRLRTQSAKKLSEKDVLLSRRDEIQGKIDEIEALGDKDALNAEVQDIKGRKETLAADIKSRVKGNKSLESRLVKAGKEIEKEKEFKTNGSARLEELTTQKDVIDDAEHIIKVSTLNIEVNKKFCEMMEPANQQLAPLNDKVELLVKDLNKEKDKLSRLIQKRL